MAKKRIKEQDYSLVIAADETTQSAAITGIVGEVAKLVVVIPDYTNTVTTTVSLINGDSKEIFTTSAMAQNDEYAITLSRNEALLVGATNEAWKVTLSGVPGGTGGTVTVSAYVGG